MGFLGRITRIHVLAAGCVLFIAVGIAFMMLMIQPKIGELRTTRQQVTSQKATADNLETKLAELALAQAAFKGTKVKFEAILAKQPPLSTSDGNQSAFDLWREFGPTPNGTGTVLWMWFARNGYDISGIGVPAPSLPPVVLPPMIMWSMNLQLRARSFGQALNFLRSTRGIPRLILISGVSGVSGHPPDLQVPLPATAFIITKNAEAAAAAPAVTEAGGVGAAPPEEVSDH